MTRAEFNKRVKKEKKALLQMDAGVFYSKLKTMYLYRHGGIDYEPLDVILTEMAQAIVLDCDLVDGEPLEEMIEETD